MEILEGEELFINASSFIMESMEYSLEGERWGLPTLGASVGMAIAAPEPEEEDFSGFEKAGGVLVLVGVVVVAVMGVVVVMGVVGVMGVVVVGVVVGMVVGMVLGMLDFFSSSTWSPLALGWPWSPESSPSK